MSDNYSVYALRYFPSLPTGEFVNVGVAVVAGQGEWAVKLADDLRDVRCLFPSAQPRALKATLKLLASRLEGATGSLILEPPDSVDPLAPIRRRLGSLNGSLRWSGVIAEGRTDIVDEEVEHWFVALVSAIRPVSELDVPAMTTPASKLGVQGAMESEFVRRGIIGLFNPLRVSGYHTVSYRYTYRNGATNIFEPVGLNYRSGATIISHAERWRGRLDILRDEVPGPVAFFGLVDLSPDPQLDFQTQTALAVISNARLERVEAVPTTEIERFGELAEQVVRASA